MKRTTTKRKAFSIVEMQLAAGVSILVLILVAASTKLVNAAWMTSNAENDAKEHLHRVSTRIAPTVRGALRVNVFLSNSSIITVVMPKEDVDGNYILPLEDGDIYQFYFSDTTGSGLVQGPILWRAKNGVADSSWSLRNGKGVVDLGPSKTVSFAYVPAADPGLIRVVIATTKTEGTKSVTRELNTDIQIRNHEFK